MRACVLLFVMACGGGHAATDGGDTGGRDSAGEVSSSCPDPDGAFAVRAEPIDGKLYKIVPN